MGLSEKEEIVSYPVELKTKLDDIYSHIIEKKEIKIKDIIKKFNIKKEQAEEWSNILSSQGLIDIYYPVIGSPTLMIKTEKKREIKMQFTKTTRLILFTSLLIIIISFSIYLFIKLKGG